MKYRFLPGVPAKKIEDALNKAPGDEMKNIDHPESSVALAANVFGFFLECPGDLILPAQWCEEPVNELWIEKEMRFPWRGGCHPWLDVAIRTPSLLIGVESKRFEPFRGNKNVCFSDTYWRAVWGNNMKGYEDIRDALRDKKLCFQHLDAAQLVKHSLGICNQAQKQGVRPVLAYLYADPDVWPKDERPVDTGDKARHRDEIVRFARQVDGDEVHFVYCSYRQLLDSWLTGRDVVRDHARKVYKRFAP